MLLSLLDVRRCVRLCIALVVVAGLLLWPLQLSAQVSTGSINGKITDSTGRVIRGVQMVLTNTATGQTQRGQTNGEGLYSFPGLQPSRYRISASVPGFDKAETTFALSVAQIAQVDLALQVGSENVVVTVDADRAVALETEDSGVSTTISQAQLQELPIDGGNSFALAALVPGVLPGGGFGISLSTDRGAVQTAGNANFSTNGGVSGSNEILLDGVPMTVCCQGQPALTPVPDIVSQFKVQTSVSQAQYGRSSGGVLNFVTNSGTSHLHGTLYEYFKNDQLNAANYFVKAVGAPPIIGRSDYRLPLRYNQFGGSVGGPVVLPFYNGRTKTFFFGAFSDTQAKITNQSIGTVPTVDMKKGNFTEAFAKYGAEIYDPSTYNATTKARSPFPNHTISAINPVAKNLLAYFPDPNIPGAGLVNNFQRLQTVQRVDRQYNIRLDHEFNTKHHTFARGTLSQNSDINPDLFNQLTGPNATSQFLQGDVVTLDHIWVLNDNNLLNLQYGLAYQSNHQQLQSFNIDPAPLGFSQNFISLQQKPGVPRQLITAYTALGALGNNDLVHYTHAGGATLTSQIGRHSLIAGVDARLILENEGNLDAPMGTFSYTGTFTYKTPNSTIPTAQSQFLSLASFELGYPASGDIILNARFSYRQRYAGLFVQDNWRLANNLTVNLGLRYDLETGPYETHNKVATIDPTLSTGLPMVNGRPTLGGLAFAGIGGHPRATWGTNFAEVGPRLGMNYRFASNSTVSAAYGIMYLPVSQRVYSVGNPGSTSQTNFVATIDNIHPANSIADPFPSGIVPLPTPTEAATSSLGSAIAGPVYDDRASYVQQWNFGVQQLLTPQTVLRLTYVGSHGVKLAANLSPNDLDPKYFGPIGDTATVTALQKLVPNPYYGIIPASAGTLGKSTVQASQLLKAFPQYTTVSENHVNIGSSTYHALQAELRWQSKRGSILGAAYTWSKSLDDVGNLTTGFLDTGTQVYQNSYARAGERSYSPTDAPQRLVINAVGKLPIGRGQAFLSNIPGWVDAVIGGWTGTTVLTMQSGLPLGLTETGQAVFSGTRPNLIAGQPLLTSGSIQSRLGGSFSSTPYLNPSAFRVNRTFELGDTPRYCGNCRAPGVNTVNASINKHFHLTPHRVDLQVRVDAFNVLNHTQFGRPNTQFGAAAFGSITATSSGPRLLQLGAKVYY